jgi:hypothetical protein
VKNIFASEITAIALKREIDLWGLFNNCPIYFFDATNAQAISNQRSAISKAY